MTLAGLVVFANVIYYGLGWIKDVFPSAALPIVLGLITVVYLVLLRIVAAEPDLTIDDPNAAVIELPPLKETLLSGLHFLLPVVLLIWVLMVEQLSPGLSAFYATTLLIVILLTQKPLIALFRGEPSSLSRFVAGFNDLVDGLGTGARNMIAIAIATAAAGIVVGTVSITGLRTGDDRPGRNDFCRQHNGHAVPGRDHLPDPRHGHADDGELYRRIDPDGAGRRRAWSAERAGRAAGRGAHVRFLFRSDGGRNAAGGAGIVRRVRDIARRLFAHGLHRLLVQHPDRHPAVHVHFQSAAAADRH